MKDKGLKATTNKSTVEKKKSYTNEVFKERRKKFKKTKE